MVMTALGVWFGKTRLMLTYVFTSTRPWHSAYCTSPPSISAPFRSLPRNLCSLWGSQGRRLLLPGHVCDVARVRHPLHHQHADPGGLHQHGERSAPHDRPGTAGALARAALAAHSLLTLGRTCACLLRTQSTSSISAYIVTAYEVLEFCKAPGASLFKAAVIEDTFNVTDIVDQVTNAIEARLADLESSVADLIPPIADPTYARLCPTPCRAGPSIDPDRARRPSVH